MAQWSKYEQEVFDSFKAHFPKADIKRNVRINGRYSKRSRQIDILIVEQTPAGPSRIVVDAKLYNRKLDVKAVDEFAGFVDDIGADRGLLITNKGYTKSAFRRAHYSPRDLELDVLDFSELHRWQAFGAIPYVGNRAFVISAPFGWVVDINRVGDALCTMFQRGSDVASAQKRKEFLYISAWLRNNAITAAELDRIQVERLKIAGNTIVSVRRKTGTRPDANVLIRYLHVKEYKCLEVTGFLEFKDIILFAVLITPQEKEKQNVRRLMHILRTAMPVTLRKDNTRLITSLKKQLSNATSPEERATILVDIGHWYRDMEQLTQARQALEKSVSLIPTYHGVRELIHVLIALGKSTLIPKLLYSLLHLDLGNPTVYNDALEFAHRAQLEDKYSEMLRSIAEREPPNSLIRANCLFCNAQIFISKDNEMARKQFLSARQIFKLHLPSNHQVFAALRFSLKQCESKKKRRSTIKKAS